MSELQVDLLSQTAGFLWALVFGALLGVLYDAFKAPRIAFKLRGFVGDLLFWLLSALLCYLFLLAFAKGEFRLFALVGWAGGAFAYFTLLSPFLIKGEVKILRILQKVGKIALKWAKKHLKRVAFWVYNLRQSNRKAGKEDGPN